MSTNSARNRDLSGHRDDLEWTLLAHIIVGKAHIIVFTANNNADRCATETTNSGSKINGKIFDFYRNGVYATLSEGKNSNNNRRYE